MTAAPRRASLAALALGVLALGGCATMPNGPSYAALPGNRTTYDQFQADDNTCRQYATQAIGGTTPQQDANNAAVGSAVVGTALGAAVGGLLGGNQGAAVGAGMGLFTGAAVGAGNSQAAGYNSQYRYDNAYYQCMYARGHKVPMPASVARSMRQASAGYPPPPNAPPPYATAPRPAATYQGSVPPPNAAIPPPNAPPPMRRRGARRRRTRPSRRPTRRRPTCSAEGGARQAAGPGRYARTGDQPRPDTAAMSQKHAKLLTEIFHDPISTNIHWREIESLLKHLGAEVESLSGARIRAKLGHAEGILHRPHHGSNALDRHSVQMLREFLARGGATPSQYAQRKED